MSIELTCSSCGQQLRVADEDAGKQARCPSCKTVMPIPGPSDAAGPSDAPGGGERWHVQLEDGSSYGPVAKDQLDRWAAEGRLTANSRLRRENDMQTQLAQHVYPSLAPKPQFAAAGQNPFADPRPAYNPNPYYATATQSRRYTAPHRGAVILVFGILGFAVCQIFGIVAWIMGANDLKEMRAGRMDNSGYGLTQAGMIIGMIATILLIVGGVFFFFIVVMAAAH